MSSVLLLVMGLAAFSIGYALYSRYIATHIYRLDPELVTPAHRFEDGVDYVPTNRHVLFGHHFTSVAGAVIFVLELWLILEAVAALRTVLKQHRLPPTAHPAELVDYDKELPHGPRPTVRSTQYAVRRIIRQAASPIPGTWHVALGIRYSSPTTSGGRSKQ